MPKGKSKQNKKAASAAVLAKKDASPVDDTANSKKNMNSELSINSPVVDSSSPTSSPDTEQYHTSSSGTNSSASSTSQFETTSSRTNTSPSTSETRASSSDDSSVNSEDIISAASAIVEQTKGKQLGGPSTKLKLLSELKQALHAYEQEYNCRSPMQEDDMLSLGGSPGVDHLSPPILKKTSPPILKKPRKQQVCAVLSPDITSPIVHFAADTKRGTKHDNKKLTKARKHFDRNGASLSMSFSEMFQEQITSPVVKATKKLVKPKRNWLILGLVCIIFALLAHQRPDMPPGLVVDDPKRPGVLFNRSSIKVKRPVAFIPGFITSALEVWESDECAAPFGASGTLFRERMFGTQMLLHLLNRPYCYMRQFGLHTVNYGADPDPMNKSSGYHIKARPSGWLDSADYFVPGYWVWAKIIRNFADIGYDPSDMLMFPYDWRLNGNLTEERDGYFHRLQINLEEMFRLSKNTKIVMVSHSYGGSIKNEFFKWVENREKGWVNRHIHAAVFVGAPMLGVTKAASALLSGEMRDLTSLPFVAQTILNLYLPRMWRSEVFRSWPCLEAMLPKGCDSLWPNFVSMFNQSVILRASDVYEAIETVSTQAGHLGLAKQVAKSKTTAHMLPHIPHSPDLKVYCLYGTGLATEVGYAYTLDQDDIGGEEAIATAIEGAVPFDPKDATWSPYFRLGGKGDVPLGRQFTKLKKGADVAKKLHHRRPPPSSTLPVPPEDATTVEEKGSWMQYVEGLGVMVRDATQKVIGFGETEEPVNESQNAAHSDKSVKTVKKGAAARGALWNVAFLGNRTSGNALMIDNSMDGVKVAPPQAIPGVVPKKNSAISRKENIYAGGVQLGVGDGTVPLMSLGFMARSPDGWVKDVGSVVTKEYLHLHDAEAHAKLLGLLEERKRRHQTTPTFVEQGGYLSPVTNDTEAVIQNVAETVASAADAVDNTTSGFTSYLNKLLDIRLPNISALTTAEIESLITSSITDFYTATDAFVQQMREGVTRAMDLRGGGASSDHVDMMGNYEMLMDVMNIATGNEDKVHERIITDIDERIANARCDARPGTMK